LRHTLIRRTLPNGLRVVLAPLPHLHGATLAVFVKVGSRHEDARTNGLSHVLEHMLFRGTEGHPSSYDLNLSIEQLGGTLDGATHTDFTMYQVTVPPANAAPVVGLLAEILTQPLFLDFDVEKRVLREEILEGLDEDGNDIDADNVVRDLVFSPHPLGFKITGSLDNVEGFTTDDLRAHMHRFYGARNVVVCAAGAVDEALLEPIGRAFGALRPGEPARSSPPQAPAGRRFASVHDDGSQTDLRISFPSPGLHDPRYPALQLLGRVLDDGLSSRLHRHIVDDRGLAYDVFAALEAYEDCGVVDLGASVEHEKTPEVLGELMRLVGALRDETVGPEELAKARQRYLWDLEALLDEAEGMASFYGTSALFDLPDTLETTAAAIAGITAEQLREVATTVFAPANAHAACVGVLERARISEAEKVITDPSG
jgi:predicted Zn-dependent peptidase